MATQINLRCSEEELRAWKRKASSNGESLSEWIKRNLDSISGVGLDGPKAVREPAGPKQLKVSAVAPSKRKTVESLKPMSVSEASKLPVGPFTTKATIDPFARLKPRSVDLSKPQSR